MSLPKPYYEEAGIVIYNADCREILPHLDPVDLVLTDPPYGIRQDRGMGGGGYDGFGNGKPREPRAYIGDWDRDRPNDDTMRQVIRAGKLAIVWGGHFFSTVLATSGKWLVWDKEQTMPTYSDCELAWTSLPGNSVKQFRYNGSGLMAIEKNRVHPTQKPVELIKWCLSLAPAASTILDPFMGSGTTLRAAKDLGRKCIGIEIEERYCEIAAKRLAQEVLNL